MAVSDAPARLRFGVAGRYDRWFNWVEIDENLVLSFAPKLFTTAMMATEMPAAMRPYSVALAALSSFRKAFSVFVMHQSLERQL